jgi:hypothetical protein
VHSKLISDPYYFTLEGQVRFCKVLLACLMNVP